MVSFVWCVSLLSAEAPAKKGIGDLASLDQEALRKSWESALRSATKGQFQGLSDVVDRTLALRALPGAPAFDVYAWEALVLIESLVDRKEYDTARTYAAKIVEIGSDSLAVVLRARRVILDAGLGISTPSWGGVLFEFVKRGDNVSRTAALAALLIGSVALLVPYLLTVFLTILHFPRIVTTTVYRWRAGRKVALGAGAVLALVPIFGGMLATTVVCAALLMRISFFSRRQAGELVIMGAIGLVLCAVTLPLVRAADTRPNAALLRVLAGGVDVSDLPEVRKVQEGREPVLRTLAEARLLRLEGSSAEAIETIGRIPLIEMIRPEYAAERAFSLAIAGRTDEAKDVFDKIYREGYRAAAPLMAYSQLLFDSGELEKSRQMSTEAQRADPAEFAKLRKLEERSPNTLYRFGTWPLAGTGELVGVTWRLSEGARLAPLRVYVLAAAFAFFAFVSMLRRPSIPEPPALGWVHAIFMVLPGGSELLRGEYTASAIPILIMCTGCLVAVRWPISEPPLAMLLAPHLGFYVCALLLLWCGLALLGLRNQER